MSRKTPLFFLVLALTAIQNVSAQRQVAPIARGNIAARDFSGAAEKMSEHVPIVLTKNKLDLQLPERETASLTCKEIVGGLGNGGSTQSGNAWSSFSTSQNFRAEMANSSEIDQFMRAERVPGKSARLLGLQTPFQKTSINQTQEELLAFHIDTGNNRVFWMKATGTKIFLVNLDESSAQSWSDVSWESLNSKHDLLSLCDSLKDVGISLPKAVPWSETASLIRDLIVFRESGWEEFMLEFAGLNSAKFEERNQASEKLAQETEKWPVAIAWGMLSPQTPPEVKSRLRSAVAADPLKKFNHLINTIVSESLHESPPALIRILENPSGPDNRTDNLPVFAQLRKVTGQEIGDDVSAWKSWCDESSPESANKATDAGATPETTLGGQQQDDPEDVARTQMFDSAKVEFSKLLSITMDENGFWKLDRDGWNSHFGGRNAAELIDALKSDFKRSGLPVGWLDIGKGYDPICIGYPQILFEKYTESLVADDAQPQAMQLAALRQNQQNRMRMQMLQMGRQVLVNSLNRDYDGGELKIKLTMSSEAQANAGNALPEEFFNLELLENAVTGRMIHFREELDHSIKLFCMGADQKKILGLGQKANGECWIHLIESDVVKTVQAPDARSLMAGNKEWFEGSVKPLFAELGIGLGIAAGGPLQISNDRPIE